MDVNLVVKNRQQQFSVLVHYQIDRMSISNVFFILKCPSKSLENEPPHENSSNFDFRPDQPVQSQEQVRNLQFLIKKEEVFYYRSME